MLDERIGEKRRCGAMEDYSYHIFEGVLTNLSLSTRSGEPPITSKALLSVVMEGGG